MELVKPIQAVSPPGPLRSESRTPGTPPVVNHFLDRLQLDALLGRYVAHRNHRLRLPPATAPALLLRCVLLGRAPLCAPEEWATPIEPARLRLTAAQISLPNDYRVGRARRFPRRHPIRWWWNRSGTSCAASTGSSGRAARTEAKAGSRP